MNKQEAIEKIYTASWNDGYHEGLLVDVETVNKLINQIDEPQKVVVPKFVAEWLKKHRHAHTLLRVLNAVENEQVVPSTVNDWILDNQYDFIKAWIDGCDIEQEKLYTVEIPDPNSYVDYRYLSRNDNGICLDASNGISWKRKKRNQFTEAEIKQDFEWAWQFAKPAEEK